MVTVLCRSSIDTTLSLRPDRLEICGMLTTTPSPVEVRGL